MKLKDKIKQELTIEDVFEFITDLGGEPLDIKGNYFISRTICHNVAGTGSYKLYYYADSQLFHCYTDCSESFDIYHFVQKYKKVNDNVDWGFYPAFAFVAKYFGYDLQEVEEKQAEQSLQQYWNIIRNYNIERSERQIVDLKHYDKSILNYLPRPRIKVWEEEGISANIIKKRGIAYDPSNNGIIIPHYDKDNNLIGIRERTLITEQERYGKYRPAKLDGQMYNHPLSFSLYNLNNSKDNIKQMKKAIIFEGEKATLLYASYFGEENDISVAVCGSNLTLYQIKLLLTLSVQEIIIAFDKEGKEDSKKQYVQKFYKIQKQYGKYTNISFIYDKSDELLDYKMSPLDAGKEVFLKLFKGRIRL